MADDTPQISQFPNVLVQVRQLAQKLSVHKRQCLLLCTVIERTLADPNSAPESAQQLDDTLNNLLERFSNWAKADVIQSYLNSDGIQDGIDELAEELRWCGIYTEHLQWAEKRRQDTDSLHDQLRIIVSDRALLERVFEQPPEGIALFTQRCQHAVRDDTVMDSARPRIEAALRHLYKRQSTHIPTPDLTSQIFNIIGTASNVRPLYKVFSGDWLDQEKVTIRSLRFVHSNTEAVKRFREDLARYNLIRHQNLAQIYGYILSNSLGCCLVSPFLAGLDSLSYIQEHGETNVIPWLRDVSSAILYLHKLRPPVFCGVLQAENILIRDDGTAYLVDFGILQLSRKPWEAVHSLLRWCAPEVIRAAKRREQGEEVASICTKQSDIYSFAMCMFGKSLAYATTYNTNGSSYTTPIRRKTELFSGEVPVHHIEDESSLEPEILHGSRPYMSTDFKSRAKAFGFNDDLQQFMHRCWQAEARSRPDTRKLVEFLTEQIPNISPRIHTQSSDMSSPRPSLLSAISSASSALQPSTPPASISGLPAGLTDNATPSVNHDSLFDRSYSSPGMSRSAQFADAGIMTSEPTQVQDVGVNYRKERVPMLNKTLLQNVHPQEPISPSEHTPRALPDRRSMHSTNSEESHLGQREDNAYERMPPLKRVGIQPPKRRGSGDTFSIVISRMREDGQINPNWSGVANMERIRGITKVSNKLKQVSAVENLIKHEKRFSEDKTHEYFTKKLEEAFGILGDKVDKFLSCIFDDATTLRLWNYQFLNALEASSDVSVIGFRPFAALCKEAAITFRTFYPEYVSHIPAILSLIKKEAAANKRFAAFMNEMIDEKSHLKLLEDFIIAPVTHLDRHHLTLQLILNEMPKDDNDILELKDAYREMVNTANVIKLTSWQSTREKKEWKDFVSADTVKDVPKVDITRQMLIYELIAEEKDYTAKIRVIHTMLNNIASKLESGQANEDAKSMRMLAAAFKEFIRFHERLLELLFKTQRELHPWIKTFIVSCGIHLIPWHALYDYRYTSAYLKLSGVLQDGNKIRQEVILGCIQNHMPNETMSLLQIVRAPGEHLRTFVDRLQKVSALLPADDEDQQVITEILPRLQDVTRQVELKLSSKDDARLSSLSLALDFNAFPGVEKYDIDLLAKSRVLIFSSRLKIGFGNTSSTRIMSLQSRIAFLLDNYLILTKKDERPEYPSLTVSEKPIPLDIVNISKIDDLPYTLSEETYPCLLLRIADHDSIYLFAESEAASKTWYQKLESAVQKRLEARVDVVAWRVVDRFSHMPNCSADIVYSGNYATLTARETPAPGIWLNIGSDARLVHQLSGITKLSVLDDPGILLAMSGQTLFWSRLDDLLGSGRMTLRSIDTDTIVSWFRAGVVAKRLLLVVSATKKKTNKSLLRFYEIRAVKPSRSLPSLKNKTPFVLLTEIELTSTIRDVYFLRNSLILVTDTFQVVNYHNPQQLKDSISSGKLPTLPLNDDPMTDLVDRCRYSFPITIHRVDKEFVLCYKDFAVYINENGRLSNKVINWVSKGVHDVLFRPPYMLTFGVSMMEVRDITTGLLIQTVPFLGQMCVSWEAEPNEDDASDLGIHLLVNEQGRQPSTGWNSLDEQRSVTLLRLLRQ